MPQVARHLRSSAPFSAVTSLPFQAILPALGSTNRLIHRKSVDLPAPDLPTTPIKAPAGISSVTFFKAALPLNVFASPSIDSIGALPLVPAKLASATIS